MKGDSGFGPEQLGKTEEPRSHLSGSPCLALGQGEGSTALAACQVWLLLTMGVQGGAPEQGVPAC